jgi:hypothetical protein
MAGNQNAFDMQIKLLMIGDSGMSYMSYEFNKIFIHLSQVLGKLAFS